MSTSAFICGRQKTLDDIIRLLSNLEADLSVKFGYKPASDEMPLVAATVRNLAHKLSQKAARNWFDVCLKQAPWLPHSLVTMIHSILVAFAEVCGKRQLQEKVAEDDDLPADALDSAITCIQKVNQTIDSCVRQQTVGIFVAPPASYQGVIQKDQERSPERGRQKRSRYSPEDYAYRNQQPRMKVVLTKAT